MKQLVLIFASLYGLFAVMFGAFGAHLLKKYLTVDKLNSFEVGVRYQMYHALLLMLLAFLFRFENQWEKAAACFIVAGTFFFSFSIYALSFSELAKVPTKILGPITPFGGLLLILGWFCLCMIAFKKIY